MMIGFEQQQQHQQSQCLTSLAESSSSSSSSSNLILSVLASTHPSSPGPLPSEGVMLSLAMMAGSSCSNGSGSSVASSSTPLPPPPPRHGLSIKSFATREEYIQAMLEDISYWVSELVFLNSPCCDPNNNNNNEDVIATTVAAANMCTADNFFSVIETGEVLCELANRICECIVRDSVSPASSLFASFQPLTFRRRVKPESFFARDNISTFLNWVSSTWHIHECLMFESDDLVLRKSEKNVILCLLEVARKAYASGLKVAPMLVHMEAEIDKELSLSICPIPQTLAAKPSSLSADQPAIFQQISFNNLVNLDDLVRDQLKRCSCPVQFPMIKVADGKYRIGNSNVLIFVRVLRSHVMVRVGGGWDTLEAYLNRHDPCRCQTGGHSSSGGRLINGTAMMAMIDNNGSNSVMSLSAHQPSVMLQSAVSTSAVDFMTCSLVDAQPLHAVEQQQQSQPSSFNSVINSNNSSNSSLSKQQQQPTASIMPLTPPLSYGDTNSSSGGESSPALAPSPTLQKPPPPPPPQQQQQQQQQQQRQRSTSRQRANSGQRRVSELLFEEQPPLQQQPSQQQQPPATTKHLHAAAAAAIVVTSHKKPLINSKRQKTCVVPAATQIASQESTLRRKPKTTQSAVAPYNNSRVRSAPTAVSRNSATPSSNNVIMIGRTSNGKHFIASHNVTKRQSISPIMKEDVFTHHRPRSSPTIPDSQHHQQQTLLTLSHLLTSNKSRVVARPRKDPLAGVTTAAPSKIPMPVSSWSSSSSSLPISLLANANLVMAPSSVSQLSPSSSSTMSSSSSSPLSPTSAFSPSRQQHVKTPPLTTTRLSLDDDQFTCVRATLVMTICEEDEDDDDALLLANSGEAEKMLINSRNRRDTGLGSSSVSSVSFSTTDESQQQQQQQQQQTTASSSSLLLNTPPEHDTMVQHQQHVDVDDLLLNDFIALERLVENEMLIATVAN